jgi:hypothetical protein
MGATAARLLLVLLGGLFSAGSQAAAATLVEKGEARAVIIVPENPTTVVEKADPANADKTAVKKTLDERFALMRQVFRQAPLALNVAYISWGEDALWSGLGWERPATKH